MAGLIASGVGALIAPAGAALAASATPGDAIIERRGREIFISLSRQRLWAYQDGEPVTSFLISSGEPKRGTRQGDFHVQSKIPEAWSNVWQLRMPYWMGIYYVGRVENGIHAMPFRPNGRPVSWRVGTPGSFGCVVANAGAAAQLYRWAAFGTPVYIRR